MNLPIASKKAQEFPVSGEYISPEDSKTFSYAMRKLDVALLMKI